MSGFVPIALGFAPGDGNGDPPRVAGEKLNAMLQELFAAVELSPAQQALIASTTYAAVQLAMIEQATALILMQALLLQHIG